QALSTARTWLTRRLRFGFDAQFAKLTLRHRRWSVTHQVGAASRLGEWNYVADGGLAGQQHHQTVEAESDAAAGRGARSQGVQKEAESAARFFVAESECGEDLGLNVAAMNTNGARAQFGSVQD